MNQKNFFTLLAAFIAIQAIVLYLTGDKLALNIYRDLDASGLFAASAIYRLVAVVYLVLALVTFGVRTYPGGLWAYTLGFTVTGIHAIKVMIFDGIAGPMIAAFAVLNLGLALVCGYLWLNNRKMKPQRIDNPPLR